MISPTAGEPAMCRFCAPNVPPPLSAFDAAANPTGDQYEIAVGGRVAVVTEVGATLRSYAVDDRDVVRGFAAEEVIHGGRGQQLLPWPNRIRDGRYTFDGDRLVTRVDGASDPSRIGSDQVRGVHFEGERMVLSPPPRQTGAGEEYRELTWERLSDE